MKKLSNLSVIKALKNLFHKFFHTHKHTAENTCSISQDDIIRTEGVDVFGYYGKNRATPTLSINQEKRNQFNQDHLLAHKLVRRNPRQPLLEEGQWTADNTNNRDHEGEDFLTYEACALLVQKRIIEKARTDSRYNASNVFVIDSITKNQNYQTLVNGLKSLRLQPNDDAKLIITSGIHAIPTYIRNINGKIGVFIAESFGDMRGASKIVTAVREAFNEPTIIRSSTPVQADFYSCATFALKSTLYFAKHGEKLFPYISQPENIIGVDGDDCFVLAQDKLPPILMKLARKEIAIPQENHENALSNVRGKGELSLRSYHQHADKDFDGKHINTAPLMKKYKYLEQLDNLLRENNIRPDDIIQDKNIKLPARLQILIDKVSFKPQQLAQAL